MIWRANLAAIWGCALAFWILPCCLPMMAAAGCERAKQAYQEGVRLINYEERRAAFQRAVNICPTYAEAHINLADALENLKAFDAAERHYREALQNKPDFHLPYIGLGEVYLKTGRLGLAEEAFRRGLVLAPEDTRLADGIRVVEERRSREKSFFKADDIESCLADDERFLLMCMCPADRYEYLRRWICVPPIGFSQGSAALSGQARRQLDEIGNALSSRRLLGQSWLIIGHADGTGDPTYNSLLSKRRAEAVKQYLVSHHSLRPESMKMDFFGQGFPRASNNSSEGRSENRRVEIVADPPEE